MFCRAAHLRLPDPVQLLQRVRASFLDPGREGALLAYTGYLEHMQLNHSMPDAFPGEAE